MQRIQRRMLAIPMLLVLCPVAAKAWDGEPPTPVVHTASVEIAKAGDTVTIAGEYLGAKHVAQVYLTDGKNDFPLTIVSQKDSEITVKVTKEVAPGKYAFMVLTARVVPSLIEQPVRLKIE